MPATSIRTLDVLHREVIGELRRRGVQHTVIDALDLCSAAGKTLSLVEFGDATLAVARVEQSGHNRSKCMSKTCAAAPTVDFLWAGGMARAWLCDKHLAPWESKNPGEIVARHVVKNNEVPERWGGAAEKSNCLVGDRVRQIVYGVYLEPNVADDDGHFATERDVEDAVHALVKSSREIWVEHKSQIFAADVVEAYVTPQDMTFSDPMFGVQRVCKGTGVVGVHVADPAVWARIESGELVGLSLKAYVTFVDEEPVSMAQQHRGVMFSLDLDPEVAKRIAVDGGEAPESLHITIAYLGDADEFPENDLENMKKFVSARVKGIQPLKGQISGIGRFNASKTSDAKDVIYASVDVPGLPEFRQELTQAIERSGLEYNREHGFTPHVTLAYIDKDAPSPIETIATIPLVFDALSLHVAGVVEKIPLEGAKQFLVQKKSLSFTAPMANFGV